MPTPNKGPRMGGSPAHERLMLSNLCAQLIEHGRITTTESKAKRLRPHVERLITFGKRGDLHSRRQVLKVVRDKSVVHTLFAEVGPRYVNRPGGYTRIVKLGPRKGDNAPMAFIELVEPLTVSQQAVGEAERARSTRIAPSRPVTGSTRESAEGLASQSPTAAGVADAAAGDRPVTTDQSSTDQAQVTQPPTTAPPTGQSAAEQARGPERQVAVPPTTDETPIDGQDPHGPESAQVPSQSEARSTSDPVPPQTEQPAPEDRQ